MTSDDKGVHFVLVAYHFSPSIADYLTLTGSMQSFDDFLFGLLAVCLLPQNDFLRCEC